MVDLLDPGTLLGRWQIRRPINTSGMLQCYEADHLQSGREALVHCVRRTSDIHRRLPEHRMQILSALREHPPRRALVPLDCGEWETLEWVCSAKPPTDAISLSECLIQHGPFSEPLAAALLRDLLDGWGDYPHLWLRPSVLWLNENRTLAAVSEYGFAHLFSDLPSPFDVCTAPEQRARMQGAAADMYACGVILFEALTGIEPFHDDPHYVARAAIEGLPSTTTERRDLTHAKAFDRLIEQLTCKRPEERPTPANVFDEVRVLAESLRAPKPTPLLSVQAQSGARPDVEEDPLDWIIPQSSRRPVAQAREKPGGRLPPADGQSSPSPDTIPISSSESESSEPPDAQSAMEALKLAIMRIDADSNAEGAESDVAKVPEDKRAAKKSQAKKPRLRQTNSPIQAAPPPTAQKPWPRKAMIALLVIGLIARSAQPDPSPAVVPPQPAPSDDCAMSTTQACQNITEPQSQEKSLPSLKIEPVSAKQPAAAQQKSFQMVDGHLQMHYLDSYAEQHRF